MTEWANFMSSTMWAGYSSRRGLTLNPYGPGEMFVGGSSSGSGAAVAANLAAAAIGTETSGSIISPSSQNSLVGLKPTIGLISRTGIIPITHTQDTAGPMTRTVEDAAILLSVIAGADDLDEVTKTAAQAKIEDYTKFLDASYLKRSRIGIPRYYYKHLDRDRLDIVESAIDVLREQGATIIDPVELPCQGTRWDANVLRYEFKKYVNDYLANVDPSLPVHSLAEVIAYNEAHADIALKYGQNTLIWAEETSGTLTEKSIWRAGGGTRKGRATWELIMYCGNISWTRCCFWVMNMDPIWLPVQDILRLPFPAVMPSMASLLREDTIQKVLRALHSSERLIASRC